jgi:hypothetical protein
VLSNGRTRVCKNSFYKFKFHAAAGDRYSNGARSRLNAFTCIGYDFNLLCFLFFRWFDRHNIFPAKAGEGSRTLVNSLEGYGSTVELHPRSTRMKAARMNAHPKIHPSSFIIFSMGGEGFEPSKALPSDLQSDPFDRSGNPPFSFK